MRSVLAVTILTVASVITADVTVAQPKGCPPGLAKKDPACVPPGQANKGVSAGEARDHHRRGDVVDRGDLFYLENFARYDLPPLPSGQRYAVVDDRIVVIDSDSYRILQLIQVFTALRN